MREGDSSLASEGRQQRSGYRRGATAGERGARAATSGRAALPSSMVQREFESPTPSPRSPTMVLHVFSYGARGARWRFVRRRAAGRVMYARAGARDGAT